MRVVGKVRRRAAHFGAREQQIPKHFTDPDDIKFRFQIQSAVFFDRREVDSQRFESAREAVILRRVSACALEGELPTKNSPGTKGGAAQPPYNISFARSSTGVDGRGA